jgi:hypothetical protein
MTTHIIKLCVGAESIDSLTLWQAGRLKETGEIVHTTRMTPRRREEVLDGGSLYWVIKGFIQVRQRLLNLREFTDGDGIGRCDLVLDPDLVPTAQAPRRAFQGWRYLKPDEAPPDLARGEADDALPLALRQELRAIGVM